MPTSSTSNSMAGRLIVLAGVIAAVFFAFYWPGSLAAQIKFGDSQSTSFSGIARIDGSRFLVVHDTKDLNAARLGILKAIKLVYIAKGGPSHELSYVPMVLSRSGWKKDPPPKDFESVCLIPGSRDAKVKKNKDTGKDSERVESWEFLVAESGDYKHDAGSKLEAGYIYHLRLEETEDLSKTPAPTKKIKGKILTAYRLPPHQQSADKAPGDNFEGLACGWDKENKNKIFVLIGERGGRLFKKPHARKQNTGKGYLMWTVLNPDPKVWKIGKWAFVDDVVPPTKPLPRFSPNVPPTKKWKAGKTKRSVASLFICGSQVWASATQDDSDDGPFRSLLYQIADFVPARKPPFILSYPKSGIWVPDHKVEGLEGYMNADEECSLVAVTDDENKGGTFLAYP